MSKEELAQRLHGRSIGAEITEAEGREAAASGLVVLFGASDDLAEFRGAINNEAGCYDGGMLLLVDGKLFDEPDCECRWAEAAKNDALQRAVRIEAVWCGEGDYSWTYRTEIPHATFDVLENGEPYCRGIVFELAVAAQKEGTLENCAGYMAACNEIKATLRALAADGAGEGKA